MPPTNDEDLPVDASQFTAASLRAAMGQSANPVLPQESIHDVSRGVTIEPPAPMGSEPVADTLPEEITEPVAEPVAEPVSDDPPVQTLDEAMAALSKDKRMRLGHLDEPALRAVLLSKRNPDAGDFLSHVIESYGKEAVASRLGVTVKELDKATDATPAADTPAAPDAISLAEAELDTLQERIVEANKALDWDVAAELTKEWQQKTRALDKLSRAAATPEAKAPETPATEKQPEPDAAHMAAFEADWQQAVNEHPDAAVEGSLLRNGMIALRKEWEAKGDRRCSSPTINSTLADIVAAKLNHPPTAAPTPAPVTKSVPGPASSTPRRAEMPAPQVDIDALADSMTPSLLRRLMPRATA